MKKTLFFILTFLMVAGMSYSQDYKKALKNASKAIGKYNSNPTDNKDKLATAMTLIEDAFASDEAKSSPKAWVTKGKIFAEIASAEINQKLLNPAFEVQNPDAAITALNAFLKGMELNPGKGEKKDALRGIGECENHLNNAGALAYEKRDFAGAFTGFEGSIVASDFLKSMGEKTRLEGEEDFYNQLFSAAFTGYYSENFDAALPYMERVYDSGKGEAVVYEAMYTMKLAKEDLDALKYLEAGLEKFPDDTALLFAEINHYLHAGKLEELTSKLEMAIEKEPNNTSVYVTLGNIYDQLSTSERSAGNEVKADEYFDLAHKNFSKVGELDSTNFDAQYSLGALYYNKAAGMTEMINEFANDFSDAGTANYNKLKDGMNALFTQALPYFLNAETLNGEDKNTLIALREIFARKDELTKATEYKAKFEALK